MIFLQKQKIRVVCSTIFRGIGLKKIKFEKHEGSLDNSNRAGGTGIANEY